MKIEKNTDKKPANFEIDSEHSQNEYSLKLVANDRTKLTAYEINE